MKLFRATILHTPQNPFQQGGLEGYSDGGLLVEGGRVRAIGNYGDVRRQYPQAALSDLAGGLLLPGFVDTHIHYPQVRVVGGLGLSLLDWLESNTLPEEARLADLEYARTVAKEFLQALTMHATTSAMVFGAHFCGAQAALFEEAQRRGLRVVSGMVISDRMLRPELHQTPAQAYREGQELTQRFHGKGKLLYCAMPRFSLSASEAMLEVCQQLMQEAPGVRFHTHINENDKEIATVLQLFPWAKDYLETYERFGLIGRHSVLAHNLHPTDSELSRLGEAGASVSHCPCSNAALGSGFFRMRDHLHQGVRFGLGTDVGGGTGYGMLKEALQAYFMQRLMPKAGLEGMMLTPAQMLYLVTKAGADALGLEDVGSFEAGMAADMVYLHPPKGGALEAVFKHAESPERMLAATFAMAGAESVAEVWVEGMSVYRQESLWGAE